MCRRHIVLELLVLPAVRAGKEFMAQLPHSRGAKRRENAAMRGAFRSGPLDGVVEIFESVSLYLTILKTSRLKSQPDFSS